MKTVTVVQARMGSTRLPGKVMLPVGGKPLLSRMMERLARSQLAGQIVIATTTDSQDDAIVDLCRTEGFSFFRGHPTDCLDRHLQSARAFGADTLAKIPSDCPLIDPGVVDEVYQSFFASAGCDYASNLHPPSHPDGNDVEVMTVDALERASREATQVDEREHTTPYLWRNPQKFKILNVLWQNRPDLSLTYRLTIDYPEDLDLIRRVWEGLTPEKPAFSVDEIVSFLDAHPEIHHLNQARWGQFWYNTQKKESVPHASRA